MATFNLTKNADTGAAFKGTTGNDVYNAAAVATALLPVQTLNSNDKIDAGDGRDTMNVQLSNVVTAPQKLLNLEVLKFTAAPGIFSIAPTLLDLSGANAVDSLVFNGMSRTLAGPPDVAVTNISSVIKNVTIRNDVALLGPVQYGVQLTGAATDGTTDKMTINLQRANSSLTVTSDSAAATAGYETMSFKSTGGIANVFNVDTFAGQGPDRITVSGTQDLTLSGDILNFSTLTKFQAGTFTGDLNVQFTGTGATALVKGGTGMDAIDLATTGGAVTIKTAAGVDAVTLSGAHTGDLTVDLGAGDATIGNESFNTQGNGITGNLSVTGGDEGNSITADSVTGNVAVTTGDAADTISVADLGGLVGGNVTVDAGEGDNSVRIGGVTGTIIAMAGAGADTFAFTGNGGTHSFGLGDSVDGGAGFDTASFEVNSAVDASLVTDGTITNIETVIHVGTISGGNDLLVDMDKLGSAGRLELRGTYTDDVRISNLNFGAGDTVAVVSDISDDLVLNRALLTAPAFNVEIGNTDTTDLTGTIINDPKVGTGSDLLNLKSVGHSAQSANQIEEADAILASVAVSGDHSLIVGDSTVGHAYEAVDGTFDASALTGDLIIDLGVNSQTVVGSNGAGSDQLWLRDASAEDTVTMGAGAGRDALGIADQFGAGTLLTDVHSVAGFNADEDQIVIDLAGVAADIANFPDVANGSTVAAGDALTVRNVTGGLNLIIDTSSVNFLKFTDSGLTGATATDLYRDAISGGSIDVTFASDTFLGSAYDSANGQVVLFDIIGNGAGELDIADSANALARFDMSYADYLAKFANASDDILFV